MDENENESVAEFDDVGVPPAVLVNVEVGIVVGVSVNVAV